MYNNNFNQGGYFRENRNNRGYYNYPQQQQPQQQFKRSGAVYSTIRNGAFAGHTIVNAWKVTKNGILTAKVAPYSGTKEQGLKTVLSNGSSGNTPKEYQKMICTITNKTMGTSQIYPVLMNLQTKVIVIQDLGMCITPNGSGQTRSGKRVTGYFGRNYRTK